MEAEETAVDQEEGPGEVVAGAGEVQEGAVDPPGDKIISPDLRNSVHVPYLTKRFPIILSF